MIKEFKYQFVALYKYKFKSELIYMGIYIALVSLFIILMPVLAQCIDMSLNTKVILMGLGYCLSAAISLLIIIKRFNDYKSGSAQYRLTLGSSYAKQMTTSALLNMFYVAISAIPFLIFSLMTAPFSTSMELQIFFMVILLVPFIYFLYMVIAGVTGRESISRGILPIVIAGLGYVFVNGFTLPDPQLFFIQMRLIDGIWFYVPLIFALLCISGIWFVLPKLKWMRQSVERVN